ncbi:MAG: AAA family ATPase [Burkholderiales bacterium]|nr:AAA family ATPase [Burkholderiales bacterium]
MTVRTRPIEPAENASRAAQAVQMRTHTYAHHLLNLRRVQAIDEARGGFPICREFSIAVRLELPEFLDDLAIGTGWRAERLSDRQLVLEPPGALIECAGTSKRDYCSCRFQVWTASLEQFWRLKVGIVARAGPALITQPMFTLEWHFLKDGNELAVASMEERADDVLFDQAYPQLEGGVAGFIERYLESPSAVLVLHGPPGTGKTRLIRAILGAMSRRLGAQARVMVTSDACALAADEIFTRFLAGSADAFVVEDADHLLRPRADGNEHLHRFLTVADGVAHANGRKIIFSSNLPNIGDMDDALIRPGRCFARVRLRELTLDEAAQLWRELARGRERAAGIAARAGGRRALSLAEIYQAAQDAFLRRAPIAQA